MRCSWIRKCKRSPLVVGLKHVADRVLNDDTLHPEVDGDASWHGALRHRVEAWNGLGGLEGLEGLVVLLPKLLPPNLALG